MLIQNPETNTTDLCETKKIRETESREHAQMIATLTTKAPVSFYSFTDKDPCWFLEDLHTSCLHWHLLTEAQILPRDVVKRVILHDEENAPEFPCTSAGPSTHWLKWSYDTAFCRQLQAYTTWAAKEVIWAHKQCRPYYLKCAQNSPMFCTALCLGLWSWPLTTWPSCTSTTIETEFSDQGLVQILSSPTPTSFRKNGIN